MDADQLLTTTASLFDVEKSALLSNSRTARVAKARQALAWALRQEDWSLEAIGNYLGRDHTTIMHSVAVVERKAACDSCFADRLQVLRQPAIDWPARVRELEARVQELEKALAERGGDIQHGI